MSDDEFDKYDLSEFTEQDFALIDATIATKHRVISKENPGPAIQIELDHSSNSPQSPFKFLSWKKYFSVTDLVSPIWCEVQYEYGLYGRRNRPLERRPSSFTSKNGKVINVHQHTAQTNDRRLKRGKSVHQALEDELRPVKTTVRVFSPEERFGLRLVQLVDGFRELTLNGITRELPVFTITHGQVIQGVIDEVLRSPLGQERHDANITTRSSPPKKKQRRYLSPSQQHLLSILGSQAHDNHTSLGASASEAEPLQEQPESNAQSSCTTDDVYELRIVDYKTRRSSNVPVDEDTLSSRLQLMLYHRMLTSLLQPETFDFDLLWNRLDLDPTKPFSDQFLEDINWKGPIDTVDRPVNLSDLVELWISTVYSERELIAVCPQLQLVYRRSAYAGKDRGNGKGKAGAHIEIDDPLEALLLQDEFELARAIGESLRQMGHHKTDCIAQAVAQTIKQAGPSSVGQTSEFWKQLVPPSCSEQPDWHLEWAIQESLLACADQNRVKIPGNTSPFPADTLSDGLSLAVDKYAPSRALPEAPETTSAISPIIGTKEFEMNNDQLDTHLADVLQWWFGARPAKGVDVSQTNRCFTCEYRGSCEWREQKGREAAVLALERKARRNDAASA